MADQDRIKQTARKSTGGLAPRLPLATKRPCAPVLGGIRRPIYTEDDEDDNDLGSSEGEDEVEFAVPTAPDSSTNGFATAKPGPKRAATNPCKL